MTAPLDLDGLEQKAKVARQDGFQWMQFRDAAMPEAVLALIARVRKLEESREHWRILEMGASGRVCELEEENDSIREKLKIAEEALELAKNAFENNWAIDWNDLDIALAKIRGMR